MLVQYCNPGKDLTQPFAKCLSIWFAHTGLRVYALLFLTDMGLQLSGDGKSGFGTGVILGL